VDGPELLTRAGGGAGSPIAPMGRVRGRWPVVVVGIDSERERLLQWVEERRSRARQSTAFRGRRRIVPRSALRLWKMPAWSSP